MHDIIVGTGILDKLTELTAGRYSTTFIVTDTNVAPHWLSKLQAALPGSAHLVLPAGEQHKTVDSLAAIWAALHRAGCDRKSVVVALGGGVIGDIAGLAAATYMRGVDCIQVPTSLLAQIDSSIGGKTGIDHDGIKNLVGVFRQPAAVVLDTETLGTLPDREFTAGFAEIIKHGVIKDRGYFDQVTSKTPRAFNAAEMENIITGSCRIKAGIVQHDPTEAGLRKLLNFGHTIGHAVEALSLETDTPLLHGEAVSIGMAIEAELACRMRLLDEAAVGHIRQALEAAALPTRCPRLPVSAILSRLRADKKNEYGRVQLSLPDAIGHALWNQTVDETAIAAALKAGMEQA